MHSKEVKGILSSTNNINTYRGCTHGCIYCDSRSNCYQINHEFEDIEVKINASLLLEKALKNKKKKCMITTGSMCDPYIPLELEENITRKCLEVINKYGFGLSILTKSDRILRDLDLLSEINKKSKCVVQMTLTTFDEDLCKIIEPNVATTKRRFEVLKIMHEKGIKTIVWLTPILPFINDTEENLRGILNYCIEAKVYGLIIWDFGLTLREGNREYYYAMLDKYFPGLKEKYIKKYGESYIITSDNNAKLTKMFKEACQKHGIIYDSKVLFEYIKKFPSDKENIQLSLWD